LNGIRHALLKIVSHKIIKMQMREDATS
jgi:hypothetical protein